MLEGRVAGVSNDEGTKDRADTSSGSGDSNGGSSGTDELGSGVNVFLDRGSGQGSAGLLRELHFKLKKTLSIKRQHFYLVGPHSRHGRPLELGNDIPGASETSNGIHFVEFKGLMDSKKNENDQLRLYLFKCRTRQIASSQDGDHMVKCLHLNTIK